MDYNYVIIYQNPYINTKKFYNYYEVSRYLVSNSIKDYSIYERMDGMEEVEMIVLKSKLNDFLHENNVLKNELENKNKMFEKILKEKENKIKELETKLKVSNKILEKSIKNG
jgi:hypothetical protein